jgi:hypothetical protein
LAHQRLCWFLGLSVSGSKRNSGNFDSWVIYESFTIFYKLISVACTSKICCFKYYIVADILTLVGLGALIGFDIYFLIYPYACLLTSTCTSNPAVTSFRFMQALPAFTSYTAYNSKQLFFYIQIGCAGLCFLIILIHLIVSCISFKKRKGWTLLNIHRMKQKHINIFLVGRYQHEQKHHHHHHKSLNLKIKRLSLQKENPLLKSHFHRSWRK